MNNFATNSSQRQSTIQQAGCGNPATWYHVVIYQIVIVLSCFAGIKSALVGLMAQRGEVKYDKNKITPDEIVIQVKSLGFGCSIMDQGGQGEGSVDIIVSTAVLFPQDTELMTYDLKQYMKLRKSAPNPNIFCSPTDSTYMHFCERMFGFGVIIQFLWLVKLLKFSPKLLPFCFTAKFWEEWVERPL